MTLLIDEKVLGLEIAVDNSHSMHVVQGRGDLGHVMHGAGAAEATLVLQVKEELAT